MTLWLWSNDSYDPGITCILWFFQSKTFSDFIFYSSVLFRITASKTLETRVRQVLLLACLALEKQECISMLSYHLAYNLFVARVNYDPTCSSQQIQYWPYFIRSQYLDITCTLSNTPTSRKGVLLKPYLEVSFQALGYLQWTQNTSKFSSLIITNI